jgi:hypothetical protein
MIRKFLSFLAIALLFAAPALACKLVSDAQVSDELIFSPDTLPEARVGQPYNAIIELSNQRTPAFSMGAPANSLPAGLTGAFDQDKQTYTIRGTPTIGGTYPLTISALCYGTNVSGQSGEKEFTLMVRE